MSLRMPQSLSSSPRFETGLSVLEAELHGERAFALGRLGREVERAVTALRDAEAGLGSPERNALLKAACTAVWYYFIQREVSGLRDHRLAIADYRIPREVLVRLGAL